MVLLHRELEFFLVYIFSRFLQPFFEDNCLVLPPSIIFIVNSSEKNFSQIFFVLFIYFFDETTVMYENMEKLIKVFKLISKIVRLSIL